MADVAVQNPSTGELRMVAEEDAPSFTEQTGWTVAGQAQREHGAKMLESGTAGQQALATGETALRTATFGLVPGVSKGWKQRSEVLHEEHPYVEMGARAAGALAPALATGGLAGGAVGAAEAAGISARAAGAVAGGLEGLAGGTADEVEQARQETRDVSVGNIFLYGLGGEIAGRALPGALKMGAGQVRRALTAAEEVAGEGLPSALAGVEARSVESEARIARDLPQGPERTALLDRTAPQQYEHLAQDGAETVEKFHEQAQALATPNKRVTDRIRRALPDESPAQQNWFTEQKRGLVDEYLNPAGPRRAAPAAEPGMRWEQTAPAESVDDFLRRQRGEAPKDAPIWEGAGAKPPAVPDAAAEYALDAARRRLRGVADHTGRQDLDALAGEIGERSAAAKSLPDEVKKAINERTGQAKLDEVVGWVKDPEALRAGHGIEPPPTPEAPASGARPVTPEAPAAPLDLGAYGKDVRNIVRPGLRRMDQAASIADQYLVTRDMASQFEAVAARVQKDGSLAPSVRDEIATSIGDRAKALRTGLTDESLFGDAAKLESDLSRGAQKMNAGLSDIEALSDPSKMRKFLQSDRIDRMRLGRKMDDALDGAEDLLATHEAHGTLDPKQIAEQRAHINRLREGRALADEIQVAKSARAEPVTPPSPSPGGSVWHGVAEFAAHEATEMLPYAVRRPVQVMMRLAKRIKGIDEAARAATKQTARRLAGTAAPAVERAGYGAAFGKAVREEAAATVDRAVPGASKAYQAAKDLLGRQQARTGTEGAVTIESGVHPAIDRLATKLDTKLSKLRDLEGTEVPGTADELGINPSAEKHAGRLEKARGDVAESLHALRDEYHTRIGDTLEGRTPEELPPKAKAKYERYKSGLDELEGTLAEHGAKTEQVAGIESYELGDDFPQAAESYLKGKRTGNTEAGYANTGVSLKGILTSPMALTAGGGAALLGAPKAMSALERFQGDYSGPEESFLAKKKLLDQDLVAPDALFEALGSSMEDLPKLSPDLFQKLSARMADKMRFVRSNLPPGIKTTMMYPNGTPPSMSAMRDFAMLWNTTMHPHSVLEDIDAGTATGQQMKILRQSDPDLYEQLHSDVVSEIGQNFRNVPLSTKLQMDILFDADGVAGPFFSSKAAGYIAQANKEQAARGPSQQKPATPLDKMSSTSGPAGLGAIQSSVTNKGQAA